MNVERRGAPGATGPRAAVGRAFLVGCPRSGTTLLQSLIAAHPEVVSPPETSFFARIAPTGRRGRLGLAPRDARAALADLDALGLAPDPASPTMAPATVAGYAACFVRRMDRTAREAGALTWLEKTPRHARRIDLVEHLVPGARFIHLVRRGEAVVASLREASELDPVVWPAMSIDGTVAMWRRYIGYSRACVGRDGHVFVSYERLVAQTRAVMRALCASLGVRHDDRVLDEVLAGYGRSAGAVVGRPLTAATGTSALAAEPWKQGVDRPISDRNALKFQRMFTAGERAQISAAVDQERPVLAAFPFL